MGLFSGQTAENAMFQLKDKLKEIPLLNELVLQIKENKQVSWLRHGQSYYDSCVRTIKVSPDSFEIVWSEAGPQGSIQVIEKFEINYTSLGYVPLHSYPYNDNKKTLNTAIVVRTWATVIKEKLSIAMPELSFQEVSLQGSQDIASFNYTVPALRFKDWF